MDFMARRVQSQLNRLKDKHPRAFMFIDEPGMQFIFSSVSGYPDQGPRGPGPVPRPNRAAPGHPPVRQSRLGVSPQPGPTPLLDIYTNGDVFRCYGKAMRRFLERGGVLAWGIIPDLLRKL